VADADRRETIAASSRLGYMAMQAREFLLVDVVVLAILIYALLGKLADSVARVHSSGASGGDRSARRT
jgi:ABC-type nitrate/sulfonate/bicarbonate transport system permease component